MSRLWMNVRIFSWHIQAGEPHWYSVRLSFNGWHKERNWPDGWFSWY